MIDIHTHMGRLFHNTPPIKASDLVRWMDKNGIEKAVVLPISSPEDLEYFFTSDDALRACRRYPDRLIPFCNVDPRHNSNDGNWDPYPIIAEYVEKGCKGLGEVLAKMNVDDPRMKKIYAACGRLGIPVLPEFRGGGHIALQDEVGMPRLEKVLQEFPETIFLAHGPGFWAEISADVTEADKEVYPTGKIQKAGKVDYLLGKYPNLYGDLSARSAYTALVRDEAFGKAFLERHASKLMFGTDYFVYGMATPIVQYIRDVGLDAKTFHAITRGNAEKVLKL